jgi:diguanylate cyclase (GGDEF)-like protein
MGLGAIAALVTVIAIAPPVTGAPILINAHQVRGLPPAEAKLGHPVQVRGLVTNLSGWKSSFFFQDETSGISVDREDTLPEVRPGDEVVIDGLSAPGLFAPVIISRQVRVVGHRALPPAPLLRFDQIATGQEDGQRIAVRGVIRSASIAESWGRKVLFLNVDLGVGNISARVHDFAIGDPASLVDAEVTVQGVCGTNFNERRQFVGLRLFVNDLSDVRIERAAPADPFAIPSQPVAAILQFSTLQMQRHRVKVEGLVTYQKRGQLLYLQNGNDGVYVETTQDTPVAPGAHVEVAGFASPGAYSPVLASSVFHVIGPPGQPHVTAVRASHVIERNANMFMNAPYDALLVKLRGTLIERVSYSGDEMLVLRDGGAIFRARLAGRLNSLAPGSLLEVTGVCSVRADESREPRTFEIALRTPADVTLIQSPSWWNLQHTLEALGLTVVLVLAAIAWAAMLQRRVKAQTRVIRDQLKNLGAHEAALESAHHRLREALKAEQELARSDSLTGVRNRRAFYEAGQDEARRSRRYHRTFTLAYVDLDNFKVVNDTLGHSEGDLLLVTVAEVLRHQIRSTDVIARLGGDEFALLLPETGDAAAHVVLAKLRGALAEAMQSHLWPVTFSMGAIVCETPPASFEELVREADELMYSVKKSGKGRLTLEVRAHS